MKHPKLYRYSRYPGIIYETIGGITRDGTYLLQGAIAGIIEVDTLDPLFVPHYFLQRIPVVPRRLAQ